MTAGFSLQDEASPRATGASLPYGRYLLAAITGNKGGSKGLMALRVKPTPTRFPTSSLYTPMDNTSLHFILSWATVNVGTKNAIYPPKTQPRQIKNFGQHHLVNISRCATVNLPNLKIRSIKIIMLYHRHNLASVIH